jgi:ATP-binding cassette subfamily F protein uup
MEAAVLAAETRVDEARRLAEDPAIASDAGRLQQRLAALAERESDVARLYARWAELEGKRT